MNLLNDELLHLFEDLELLSHLIDLHVSSIVKETLLIINSVSIILSLNEDKLIFNVLVICEKRHTEELELLFVKEGSLSYLLKISCHEFLEIDLKFLHMLLLHILLF